ncbi:hypothetical protein V1477_018909 [Vespula maculifrons]|uniref:Uncharacterized protein n=1 Tax=Vespula maculifrons TaxID=7453 RepID=A0ABD2ASS3_VESMC
MAGKEKRMVGTKSFDLWFRPTMSGYDVSKNIDDYDKERDTSSLEPSTAPDSSSTVQTRNIACYLENYASFQLAYHFDRENPALRFLSLVVADVLVVDRTIQRVEFSRRRSKEQPMTRKPSEEWPSEEEALIFFLGNT